MNTAETPNTPTAAVDLFETLDASWRAVMNRQIAWRDPSRMFADQEVSR